MLIKTNTKLKKIDEDNSHRSTHKMISPSEAAKKVGVHPITMRKWIREKLVPGKIIKFGTGRLKYFVEENYINDLCGIPDPDYVDRQASKALIESEQALNRMSTRINANNLQVNALQRAVSVQVNGGNRKDRGISMSEMSMNQTKTYEKINQLTKIVESLTTKIEEITNMTTPPIRPSPTQGLDIEPQKPKIDALAKFGGVKQ